MLPHVDAHLPVHNIASLKDLAAALARLGRIARAGETQAAPSPSASQR
jgi:hypothetical protein